MNITKEGAILTPETKLIVEEAEKLLMESVRTDPTNILSIRDPWDEMKIIAIKADPSLIPKLETKSLQESHPELFI